MQTIGRVLLLVFLFTCCFSIPVTDFIGHPFDRCQRNHGTLAPADDNFITVGLSQNVSVHGQNYSKVHISSNGVLSFNSPIKEYESYPFPTSDKVVAPFWADFSTKKNCIGITNTIFYREFILNHLNDEDDDDNRNLKDVSNIVESSFYYRDINGYVSVPFNAKWAFAVTWREVPYENNCNTYNDFQVVLATNDTMTFAILNYARIDAYGSKKTDNTIVVGVNAGDLINHHTHPNADGSRKIYNIEDAQGNTCQPGQMVYRIDAIRNEHEGKFRTRDFAGNIKLIPNNGTVFGGTVVRIITSCVGNPTDIKCTFGRRTVPGDYIKADRQFSCVTPKAKNRKVGQERFILTFTDGVKRVKRNHTFYRTIYDRNVLIDSRGQLPIPFKSSITLYWNPDFISLENPRTYRVNIKVFELTPQNNLEEINTGEPINVLNSGRAKVKVPNSNSPRAVILAYFQVTVASTDIMSVRQIYPKEMPTQWIFAMLANIPSRLYAHCRMWLENEPAGSTLMELVEPCPPREARALEMNSNLQKEDIVECFVQGVDIEKSLNHDFYHRFAHTCYIQRTIRNGTRAGNQCCYKDGDLCIDQHCGGTVDKVAPRGDFESCLDHYVMDIIPAIACSPPSNHGLNQLQSYIDKRPIDNGTQFELFYPDPPAVAYGDPHIVTLDGHKYTFNGRGEFTLIETESEEFVLQGRMIQATDNIEDSASATVFSSIVGKETNSDTVQIELDPFGGLVALVNGEEVRFEELNTLEFSNVTVSNHGGQNISATFACGAYINIKQRNGIISGIVVSLSKALRGRTRGLMGNYNGNTSDDLIPKGSTTPISLESTLQVIHEQFGVTWIIRDEMKSLFTYGGNQSWADYYDPLFVPVFEPTFSHPSLEANARRICNGDSFCLFDIAVTSRIDIGVSTLHENQDHDRLVELSLPIVCNPECGHGLCVDNDTCSCVLGYKGKLCTESDVGPCDVNICQNGGRCTRVSDTQRCDCREGYVGDRCETATATPTVRVPYWSRFDSSILLEWRVRTIHRIEMFRVTVFDITVRNLEDLNLVLERELPPQTTQYRLSTIPDRRYFVQVEARVGGRYGTPGTVEVVSPQSM